MAARASRDYLNFFWEEAREGAILVDGRLKIAALNPAAELILGQAARLAIGSPLRELIEDEALNHALAVGKRSADGALSLNRKPLRWSLLTVPVEGSLKGALLVLNEDFPPEDSPAQEPSTRPPEYERLKSILAALLDGAIEGITVVDEAGRIVLMNRAYCDFLEVGLQDVLGKPVEQVLENTRLPVVLKTGEPEYRQVQRMKGHDTICDRIPVREDGRIVGAVGKVLFRDISEVKDLLEATHRLQQEVEYYKGQLRRLQGRYSLENIVGQSRQMVDLREMVRKVARSSSTVLLRGESGTGKELVAHAIHNASDRGHERFVMVNCAAIPETLLESELFGYEDGAFTGARKGGHPGKFEQANRGTIFLDEIGDMPLGMQSKLLRVLQEKEIERIGASKPVAVDARVVAATNQDLDELVKVGRFRHDLYYRLNVFSLELPSLRLRRDDIPALVEHLLGKLGKTLGCGRKRIDPAALEILVTHHWPGNVRELENVLERALNVAEGGEILPRHLPCYLTESQARIAPLPHLKEAVARTEKELVRQALLNCKGDSQAAARLLGVSKSTFYEKASRYKLN